MKKTTASRICDFQWDLNILHNNIVAVCPSEEINTTSLAQTHHYWVPLIHSLYLYENVFFFYNHMEKKRKNGFLHSARSFHSICGLTEWVTKQTRRKHMCAPPRPRPVSALDISIHEHHWLQRRKGGQPCHCAQFEDISCKMSRHH